MLDFYIIKLLSVAIPNLLKERAETPLRWAALKAMPTFSPQHLGT